MNDMWLERRDRFLTDLRKRPQIMGILNVTPDSFSDGGMLSSVEAAVKQAKRFEQAKCDILDIGGESTRPGAAAVAEEDELARVLPVVSAVAQEIDLPISIDTYKAGVARRTVEAGAVIVNDVWGLQRDPDMAAVVADTKAAVVIMHNRETTDPTISIMDDIRRFLDASLARAESAGIPRERILLDPGVGFGKTPEQSMECILKLDELAGLFGLPVLLGLSRKRFIGHVLGNEVDQRLVGTLASNVLGLTRGAAVLRVHDVAEHVEAMKMFHAIMEIS